MVSRRQVLAGVCLALTGATGCTEIREAVTADTTERTEATDSTEETVANDETTKKTNEGAEFRVTVTGETGEVELITGADVASVGEVEEARNSDGYWIPVTLTDEGTEALADGLEQVGAFEDPENHEIRSYFEGELLYEATLGPGLADAIESGEWNGEFLFTVSDRETAEEVKDALEKS